MSVDDEVHISAGPIRVDADPVAGGRIAQITVGSTPLLIGRDDVPEVALAWGWYPMVPWAGRIRNGRFAFRGRTYEVPRNHGDHAIHGVGYTSAWSIAELGDDRVRLTLDLPTDETWPFGGHVAQTFIVERDRLQCSMVVTAGREAFPVSLGWHPWFRKPDRLDVSPIAMYRRDDDHIAVDELVPVPSGPWDDCFIVEAPIGIAIDGVHVELSSPCSTWVIYDEPDHATCVEPQTAPPDAFNLAATVVEPGAQITAFCQLRVVAN